MGDDNSLRHCKGFLRRRLAHGPPLVERENSLAGEEGNSGWSHLWPVGLHKQCDELRRVLRRTVCEHESQSALLLGYPGSGKSLVLDRVLRSLAQEVTFQARAAVEADVEGGGGGKRKRQVEEPPPAGGTEEEDVAGGSTLLGEHHVSAKDIGKVASGDGQSSSPQQDEQDEQQRRRRRHQRRQLPTKSRTPFRAVYLNGAAQADDGVAMREIVQQLGITGAASRGSVYNSNLAMMVESMKTGTVNGVPVIFVLDEFERFTCRKPQTLLYALLDLCQDKTICAAVVGLSVNLNVLDVAEKRVKSRFSFRQIRFAHQDLGTIASILEDALTIPVGTDDQRHEHEHSDIDGDGDNCGNGGHGYSSEKNVSSSPPTGVSAAFARKFNALTRQTLGLQPSTPAITAGGSGSGSGSGSGRIDRNRAGSTGTGAASRSASALADLKELAASGRSVGWFLRLTAVAVGLLRNDEHGLTRRAVIRAGEMLAADAQAEALRVLSVTQAIVLVAMVRLERRGRRKDGCSFETVFREYGSYLRTFSAGQMRSSRSVILKAFGQLAEQGVLRSAEPGTGGGREANPLLHCRFRSRFELDQVHQALDNGVISAPTNVAQWCKRWQKQ